MTLYKRALFKRFKDKYAPDEVDKLALLIILAFLTIFGIMGCIEVYASDIEDVTYSLVNNLYVDYSHNYFTSNDSSRVAYFNVEKGYIYHIVNNYNSTIMRICSCDETPSLNVPYTLLGEASTGGGTFDYMPTSDGLIIASCVSQGSDNFTITREKIPGYDNAVNDLVDNVGINQIWNVFNDGISFVGVVVLVAFGIFLVVLAIRKVSKGKSEF